MDEILEAMFLGKNNVVLDVWYYCFAYIVYVVYVSSMMCALVVLRIYSMCTCYFYNVLYRMVQIRLCEYLIWGVVYILYCLHDVYVTCVHMVLLYVGYALLCTDHVMYMLDMQCYVQIVL